MANRKHSTKELEELRAQRDAERERTTNYGNDLQVLTIDQFCKLNNISRSTAKRVLNSSDGPHTVKLSDKRRGVTIGENRKWQQRRMRAS